MAKKTPVVNKEQIHELAMSSVFEVLSGKKEHDDQSRMAMKYLNYESRSEQLNHSRAKLAFSMVQSLSDRDAVRKYIQATEPVIKRLTA